jgi:hypothetical protein
MKGEEVAIGEIVKYQPSPWEAGHTGIYTGEYLMNHDFIEALSIFDCFVVQSSAFCCMRRPLL